MAYLVARFVAMTQQSDTPRRYPEVCKAGHVLSDDVVYFPQGKGAKWRCRVCLREAYARHYKMKRDARVEAGWIPNKVRHMPPLSTECSNGHPWTEASTYTSPRTNHRQCRLCRQARLKRLRADARAKREAAAEVNSASLGSALVRD